MVAISEGDKVSLGLSPRPEEELASALDAMEAKINNASAARAAEAERRVRPENMLLNADQVFEVMEEMKARMETISLAEARLTAKESLAEVREVQELAGEIAAQPLNRDGEAFVQEVLATCVEVEARYVRSATREELKELRGLLKSSTGLSVLEEREAEESAAPPEDEVLDLRHAITEPCRQVYTLMQPSVMGGTKRPSGFTLIPGADNSLVLEKGEFRFTVSPYTQKLMTRLTVLESAAPSLQTPAPPPLPASEAGSSQAGKEPFSEHVSTELSLAAALPLSTVPAGSYPVGRDLGSGPPEVRAQRLLHAPVVHDTQGLHAGWNNGLRQSVSHRSTRATGLGEAEKLFLSCHPPETFVLDLQVEITSDVLRHRHLRALSHRFPRLREVLKDRAEFVPGVLDATSRPPRPNVSVPLFREGTPCGYAAVPKTEEEEEEEEEDGADVLAVPSAVDEEYDPAVEVPFFVAEEVAAALGGRLPTWQEWEAAVRGASGLLFPWGNDDNLDCIDVESKVIDNEYYNIIKSYGWLRHVPSWCGMLALPRYGHEWNAANHDVKDATGNLAETPTTHLVRSLCDLGVSWHPTMRGLSHRTFTMPCAAAYGIPHRLVHTAAFRVAYPSRSAREVRRGLGLRPSGPLDKDIGLALLAMLLNMSRDAACNKPRIFGLLGPPESVEDEGQRECWWWHSVGCSLDVDVLHGFRVSACTVYDEDFTLPRSRRRFRGTLNGSVRFPATPEDLGLPPPYKTVGNCRYHVVETRQWSWETTVDPGKIRPRPSRRFTPDTKFGVCVVAEADGPSIVSITLSL